MIQMSLLAAGLPPLVDYIVPTVLDAHNALSIASSQGVGQTSGVTNPNKVEFIIRGQNTGGFASDTGVGFSSPNLGTFALRKTFDGVSTYTYTSLCSPETAYVKFFNTALNSLGPGIAVDILQAIQDGVITAPEVIKLLGGWNYSFSPPPAASISYGWTPNRSSTGFTFSKSSGTPIGSSCPSFVTPDVTVTADLNGLFS